MSIVHHTVPAYRGLYHTLYGAWVSAAGQMSAVLAEPGTGKLRRRPPAVTIRCSGRWLNTFSTLSVCCCRYDLKALGDSVVNTFLGELGGCTCGAGAPHALLVSTGRCCP